MLETADAFIWALDGDGCRNAGLMGSREKLDRRMREKSPAEKDSYADQYAKENKLTTQYIE